MQARFVVATGKVEVRSQSQAILLVCCCEDRLESCDDRRIELRADGLCECSFAPHGLASLLCRDDRKSSRLCIGHGDDSCKQWHFTLHQAVGIPISVYALVVVSYDHGDIAVVIDLGENSLANFGSESALRVVLPVLAGLPSRAGRGGAQFFRCRGLGLRGGLAAGPSERP